LIGLPFGQNLMSTLACMAVITDTHTPHVSLNGAAKYPTPMPQYSRKTYKNIVKQFCRERFHNFIREAMSPAKLSTARVLCFPGREALEIFDIYLPLGIPLRNIVCLEKRRGVYNELQRRHLGVVLRQQKLEEFIDSPNEAPFDIVSLDFTGQLGTYENYIYRLRSRGFLRDDAVVFTNFGAREADATKGYYQTARHMTAIDFFPELLTELVKGYRRTGDVEKTAQRVFSKLESRPLPPAIWEESVSTQRDAGIHETLRATLTRTCAGMSDILFREWDDDGALSEQIRAHLDGELLDMRDMPSDVEAFLRRNLKAARKQDGWWPPLMTAQLGVEVQARIRKLLRRVSKKLGKFRRLDVDKSRRLDVDWVAQILQMGIDTYLTKLSLVVAAKSYRYVSDHGTPMCSDMFHLRRVTEFDFLCELLNEDAETLDEFLAPIDRLSLKEFFTLLDTFHRKGSQVAAGQRAEPATPVREDLGKESKVNPAPAPPASDPAAMRAAAITLLCTAQHLTIEDVALRVGAKPMQVAAWKAHLTMGTYNKATRTLLGRQVDTAFNAGRYAEALEISERLRKREPKSVRLLNNHAAILGQMNRSSEALEFIDVALRIQPRKGALLRHRAGLLAQSGLLSEAARAYAVAAARSPRHVETRVSFGNVLSELGRFDDARAQFDRALQLDPACFPAECGRAIAQSEAGRLDQALAEFDALVAHHPTNANALYNRAIVLFKLERTGEATRDLREAVLLDPNSLCTHYNLGCTLFSCGRDEEACAAFEQAVTLDRAHLSSLHNLALAYWRRGLYDSAIETYDHALRVDPHSVDTLYFRARVLAQRGRFHEALVNCNQLVELAPDSALYLSHRGDCYTELGRFHEAMADFESALQIDPRFAGARIGQSCALGRQGKLKEALGAVDPVVKADPNNVAALLNRANSLIELKRLDDAIADLDTVLRLEPDNSQALNQKATALVHLEKHSDALCVLDEAIRVEPSHRDAIYNKATLLCMLERFDEARSVFDSCLEKNPRDYQALCNRGRLRLMSGDFGGAERDLLAALDVDPEDEKTLNCLKLLDVMAQFASDVNGGT
jgi:tetratricopeptide (TPR) repeat protein